MGGFDAAGRRRGVLRRRTAALVPGRQHRPARPRTRGGTGSPGSRTTTSSPASEPSPRSEPRGPRGLASAAWTPRPAVEPGDIDPDLDRPGWDIALAVSAGGAVGGLARLGLNTLLPRSGAGFPWATCIENVAGCLLIGVLMAYVLDVWPPSRYRRPFLGTGVLGGFTTFSAYTSDTRALLQAGHAATALVYLAISLLLGLAAVVAGLRLVRSMHRATA